MEVSSEYQVSTVSNPWGSKSQGNWVLMPINQRSPTFLAPGTGFVEDNCSTDGGGDGSGSNVKDGERL